MVTLGVFGSGSEPVVQHIRKLAKMRGVDVRIFDTWTWGDAGKVSLHAADLNKPLHDCDAFFVRSVATSGAWQARFFEWFPEDSSTAVLGKHAARIQEWGLLTDAFVDAAWALGKPMANPIPLTERFNGKTTQAMVLAAAGVPIPDTLTTNDAKEVRAFVRKHREQVVFKPISGGTQVLAWQKNFTAHLPLLAAEPLVFQERISGEDLRVTLVGGRVVSAVGILSDALDYRADTSYAAGTPRYEEVQISASLERACMLASRACKHVWSGIDVKRDGKHFKVIEVNASPVYLDIELRMKHPITDALLDYLLPSTRTKKRQGVRLRKA